MYVREIDGQETTFGTSGALWRSALVMYDRTTGSLWSQVNATAIGGEHEGKTLEEIPSVVTTWGEWKRMHPNTLVLSKPPLAESPYTGYNADTARLGTLKEGNPDERLPGKTLVVGVRAGAAAAAVPLSRLEATGVVNGLAGETPVAWVALGSQAAAAFDRRVGDRIVELSAADGNRLVDAASGSEFDAASGAAVSGPLAGQTLQRLPAMRAYWFSWASFHPDTVVVE